MIDKHFLSKDNLATLWDKLKSFLSSKYIKNGTSRPELSIKVLNSLSEYTSISNPDPNVLYFIKEN